MLNEYIVLEKVSSDFPLYIILSLSEVLFEGGNSDNNSLSWINKGNILSCYTDQMEEKKHQLSLTVAKID